jgi:superkiller protein 3
VARYNYVSPVKPAEGDRAQAERYFAQAAEAQHERRLQDAVRLYRAATRADPSFFEAQSNLGLAAFDLGDMTQALLAYEIALAIKPDSFNARFNFALALIKANYVMDAAQELERLLAASPDETHEHLAMAHLTLANLYADQFHRPASARPHYAKVLELDPQNPQATVIRYWLRDHP